MRIDAATIETNLERVRARIWAAASKAGRDPAGVTLVAVSKTFPIDVIEDAIRAGVTDLGENRAQELKEKAAVLGQPVRWHFIGPLQTNKARQVVGPAHLIHSVDRLGLAVEIAKRARSLGRVQDVLIEVNSSGEATKHGVEPARAAPLAVEVAGLDGLKVAGLMCMAPFSNDPEDSRPYYRELADLREVVQAKLPAATELSMGMTRDFEVAIEEGATLVRIGEAIFGPRAGGGG
jgi:pyridoxal phosphate enzyme (YggS family)